MAPTAGIEDAVHFKIASSEISCLLGVVNLAFPGLPVAFFHFILCSFFVRNVRR